LRGFALQLAVSSLPERANEPVNLWARYPDQRL